MHEYPTVYTQIYIMEMTDKIPKNKEEDIIMHEYPNVYTQIRLWI